MVDINRSLNLLYPPFKFLVELALDECHHKGLMCYVFEGYRFPERQAFLYAQGRTTPGAKVTWARAGESLHQYGCAIDLVFDAYPLKEGIQWTWEGSYADENGDNYDKAAKILKARGLEWLGDKNIERAHFQKTWGLTVQQMKIIADAKGVIGVWHELDKLIEGGAL
jgi:peptidoglycan L-alanyl-D-glutamate endopeptidase CwlK